MKQYIFLNNYQLLLLIFFYKLNKNDNFIIKIILDTKFMKNEDSNKISLENNKKKKKLRNLKILTFFPFLIYFSWVILNEKKKNEKFFFFLQEKKNLSYCKNFGLLVYFKDKNNSLFKENSSENIGDYIQSLAALQFLPKNCFPYLVDREYLRYYNGPMVNLIMNGWFLLYEGNKIVSDKINPIYLSFHIYNEKGLDSEAIKNLKKYEPIGSRDLFTYNILKNKNIKSYFSACLTLTLDIDYAAKKSERTNEIIFVDYSFGQIPQVDKSLLSLKAYNFKEIIKLTHMNFKISESHIERFKKAKYLLDRYARAKLVVTTRLHVAFPCLALKTPVIFVRRKKFFDQNRFSGLYQFLNTVGYNEHGKFEAKFKFDRRNYIKNPNYYRKYANNLKKTLRTIINKIIKN